MRKKGSITVFLTLLLVLLFSLILTTFEAARLTGGRAYIQMISRMAADSAQAKYYYPLFQEYGLLGVLADNGGFFAEDKLKKTLEEDVTYALGGLRGGFLSFDKPVVTIMGQSTMLSDDAKYFLAQIREIALLEGTKDVLSELLPEAEIKDAAQAPKIYKEQEKVLAQTATITQEFLRLMELVDGVKTQEEGLCFDQEGRLRTNKVFVKRICGLSQKELSERFKNAEIYDAVKDNFYSPKEHAEELLSLIQQGMETETAISECEKKMTEEGADRKNVEQQRDELVEWLDIARMDMEEQYVAIQSELKAVIPLLSEVEEILAGLEGKQLGAQLSVREYEEYLKQQKEKISEELYEVFSVELQRIKLYAGLSESGYRITDMRKEVEKNRVLLEAFVWPEFCDLSLQELFACVQAAEREMEEYSVETLWFTYGSVVPVPKAKENVFSMLDRIATGSVLSLAGVSAEELSGKRLFGQELPSAGRGGEDLQKQILACMEEISGLFQSEGFLGILKKGAEASADALAMGWYAENYFGCFGQEKEYRKLSYEREYLLFGDKTDRGNLFFSVLYLVALRAVFSMTEILKNPGKMAQLDAFAISTAGATGMPWLVCAVKYGMLFLWSLEEAFVEVAVLLDGKKVPLTGQKGSIAFAEIFFFGDEMVRKKAAAWTGGTAGGLPYGDYLLILSVLQPTQKKAYRCMDLIQENIRYRYRDSFRMRNVVAGAEFEVQTRLEQKIYTGVWGEETYEMSIREAVTFP